MDYGFPSEHEHGHPETLINTMVNSDSRGRNPQEKHGKPYENQCGTVMPETGI
jgi:hypothetical protein